MFRTLKNYVFWNYERGSIHYDIMVTLILLFIFITPHVWNYGDRPNPKMVSQVLVDNTDDNTLVYQIRASDIDKIAANSTTDAAIRDVMARVAGDVQIDHWVAVPGPDKHPLAYKVWARR